MGASIEILVCGRPGLSAEVAAAPFSIVVSTPPQSHRGPSSLWQSTFSQIGGSLFHIGDPGLSLETRRYWAYEILEEIDLPPNRYRFLPQYQHAFWKVLTTLITLSESGTVLFSSDEQFGPKAKKFRKPYTVEAIRRIHDEKGLRFNSLIIATI